MNDTWITIVPGCIVKFIPGNEDAGIQANHTVTLESIPITGIIRLVSVASGAVISPYRLQSPAGVATLYGIRYFAPPTITWVPTAVVTALAANPVAEYFQGAQWAEWGAGIVFGTTA